MQYHKDLSAFQARLYEDIPLTRALEIEVVSYDGHSLRVDAPREANVNHKGTVFGGSLNAVAVVAAWGIALFSAEETGFAGSEIVIQRSDIRYEKPATGGFTAIATKPEFRELRHLVSALDRHGMSKLVIEVDVLCNEERVAHFTGTYGIFSPKEPLPKGPYRPRYKNPWLA